MTAGSDQAVVEGPVPRPTGGWVAPVYLLLAAGMVPWIVVLALSLPDRAVSHNYRLAWVGFDLLLAVSIARTAWLAWRRSPFVVNVASATAALLVVDAWFDVSTAADEALLKACLLAALVELPLATLSMVIAGRAQVQIARTGAVRPARLRLPFDRAGRPVGSGRGAGSGRPVASGQDVARGEAGPGE